MFHLDRLQQRYDDVENKRRFLLQEAQKKQSHRRFLNVISAVLAFLSGATILSLLGSYFDGNAVKIIAAVLAFGSTLVTVIGHNFYDDRQIAQMFEGAGDFLAIREKLEQLADVEDLTTKTASKIISDASQAYKSASGKYDRYIMAIGHSQMGRLRRWINPSNRQLPESTSDDESSEK
jgi:hypothetical protein